MAAKIESLYTSATVKIVSNASQGSGCIVQTENSKFAYVLTAKHCLSDNLEKSSALDVLRLQESKPLKIHKVLTDDLLDLAIIVVDKVESLQSVQPCALTRGMAVTIYGYPNILEGQQEARQNVECTISFVHEDEFEITSIQAQQTFEKGTKELMTGLSGSGIYFEKNGRLFLTGILARLKSTGGAYGTFVGIQIQKIDELLEKNGFSPFATDYFGDLKRDPELIKRAFSLSFNSKNAEFYSERNIDTLFQNYLKSPKHIWCSGPSGVGKTLLVLRNLNLRQIIFRHIDLTCSSLDMIDDYFEYINNEIISQCELKEPSKKLVVFDRISDNLCTISENKINTLIFVDEVPIGRKEKFLNFLNAFVSISERYANLSEDNSSIRWVICTRINPFEHLDSSDTLHTNKTKALKHFNFRTINLWTDDELLSLLDIFQKSFQFNLSPKTRLEILSVCAGFPGRLKSVIERMIIEDCSIQRAIKIVQSENV